MMTPMRPLVVFDLDGTLVDSREDLAASVNDVLAGLSAPPLPIDEVTRMVGDGARTLVERALRAAGLSADVDAALAAFHGHYAGRVTATTRPYTGIPELLNALEDRATLAVLTNKPIAPTRVLFDAFEWTPRFARVIGGDDVFGRKPDPAGLLAIMEHAGVDPAATVMVGDSMADVEVARRAGTRMCFAAWGFGHARGDVQLRPEEAVAQRPGDILAMVSRRPA
jgi:phosphoglycolate phosphatase